VGLTLQERRSVTRETRRKYRRVARGEKTKILDEFTGLTEYNRKYALQLLKGTVKAPRHPHGAARPRGHPHVYDPAMLAVLKRLWAVFGFMCGKRLAAAIRANLALLEKFCELRDVKPKTRKLLLRISPATIDRLLAADRKRLRFKGRSHTRSGSLRRDQIPIRTFGEADQKQPGYVEVDLVGHDGGSTSGDYAQTLTLTDVDTGWTEVAAVRNKAQKWVFPALQHLVSLLPFPLQGMNADNGGEFININLVTWCAAQNVAFTRIRPYRKNDNPYVEQKNNVVVRSAVGYLRYEGASEVAMLNRIYSLLRLQINYLFPSMKLVEKTRIGARVYRRYDVPTTPYQRVLNSPHVAKARKAALRRQFRGINPVALAREICELQVQLEAKALRRQRLAQDRRGQEMRAVAS
jgi:hypothetical protein